MCYQDVVAEVTRRCDWRIGDIVGARLPATLYLVVPPSDINRTKPLIENEFEIDVEQEEEMEDAAARNARMTGIMQGVARQVSLDPNDGMDL